ncbi:MAG TPA: hypothetical protein VN419_10950 [Humidesulfovibrio sp.]|uniref:hypothetical protein n=1 Tax=Humidesulfovibrio sp. TaxID=2910988 RepID=UPI002CB91CBC|nr:hypothetical protein [Humidesulfovibrio sp.]HWR04525.1 hypothetical protein [Humidesulfovibrio sp.]
MRRNLLFLLLLLVPATALAQQPTYDLTCEDVKKVLIVRMPDGLLDIHSPQGFFYFVSFRTRPERKEQLQQLVNSAQRHHKDEHGKLHYWTALTVTANGKPLQNDVPGLNGNGGGNIGIFLFNEQDAFDAAREVCPTAPVEFIVAPPQGNLKPEQ